MFHLFGFLKKHHNAKMVLDPREPEVDASDFPRQDWSRSIYGYAEEAITPNAPEAL